MKKHFFIFVFAVAVISVMAQINFPGRNKSAGSQKHVMKIEVGKKSLDNSDNVLRVSCALIGIPHTSSRIDSVFATINGKRYKATDIDGVDFNRYFQWEDEDAVEVDVDIPCHKQPVKKDSIFFHTVHGIYKSALK